MWKEVVDNVLDKFFPRKLPPLELTSKPIEVKEILAEKRNPASSALSFVIHVVVIALIGVLLINKIVHKVCSKAHQCDRSGRKAVHSDHPQEQPVDGRRWWRRRPRSRGGLQGQTPEVRYEADHASADHSQRQPEACRFHPSVIMPNIKLPDTNMPDIGMPSSNQVALASNGSGSGGGMGSGTAVDWVNGTGAESATVPAVDTAAVLYHVGGGVSAPSLIYSVDPEFSDEARRAKYQGICVVSLIVDAQGNPQHVRVISSPLGMGLDQKALDAVRQYRFKPAFFQGHAVPGGNRYRSQFPHLLGVKSRRFAIPKRRVFVFKMVSKSVN